MPKYCPYKYKTKLICKKVSDKNPCISKYCSSWYEDREMCERIW